MKRENMLENPLVSRPPTAKKVISKPKLLPKMTRKSVAEVQIVKPRIVRPVWNFLLVRSFIGNEISLIFARDPPIM